MLKASVNISSSSLQLHNLKSNCNFENEVIFCTHILKNPFWDKPRGCANPNADPIVVGELPQQDTHQSQQLLQLFIFSISSKSSVSNLFIFLSGKEEK